MNFFDLLFLIGAVTMHTCEVSSAPAPPLPEAPAPQIGGNQPLLPQANIPQGAPKVINRVVDCIGQGTPQSCDIFCYATFCGNYPSLLTLTQDTDVRQLNRKQSGQTAKPFSDAGVARYGTTRRQPSFTWGDEYPPASSQEGGGTGTSRAIIQGASPPDQRNQGQWIAALWQDVPNGGQVQLSVTNWDPKESPYCEAQKNNDKGFCHRADSPFYRKSDDTGQNGILQFDHIGT